MNLSFLIEISYFVSAVLFIVGLKAMSSPKTARRGVIWAGVGMLVAVAATFFHSGMSHYALMIIAIAAGGGIAWWTAKRVAMTEMPQMTALYNGMGGGAAGAIAAIELLGPAGHGIWILSLGVLGAVIGTVAFSGSIVAFAKLHGLIRKTPRSPLVPIFNAVLAALIAVGAITLVVGGHPALGVALFFLAVFVLGVTLTLPIGGADMPVVISLLNALTGLAVGLEGFVLGNAAMMIAGTVVGASGTLLTQLMAKAMNRSLANVLFSGFGASPGAAAEGPEGEMRDVSPEDAGIMLAYAERVIIVPGYGMAVAQAQHKIWELVELLQSRDVEVKFAIHPVAGRMPGHMNVLLAEAGVPYDMIYDMEDINEEFALTDVAVVIGANDVVNPAAEDEPQSPIYGMPILRVKDAENVLVIKRGRGAGFSGVENKLFFEENTRMVFGDGQKVAAGMVQAVKNL